MTAAVFADGATTREGSAVETSPRRGIGWTVLLRYGPGGLSEEVATFGLSNMLLFYLTVVCGMSGASAGLILGMTLIVDGLADPIIGSLSDNFRSRLGRRHPFMIAGALLMAVSYGSLFSVPAALEEWALVSYVGTFLFLLRLAHGLFTVPYAALGAELTDDYHQRSLVVASRNLFSKASTWITTFLAYGVFLKGEHGLVDRGAYIPLAWTLAGISLTMAGVCVIGTLSFRHNLHQPTTRQRFSIARLVGEIGEVFGNRSFRLLFVTILTFLLGWGAVNSLGLHVKRYFWHLSTHQILVVQMTQVAGGVAGIFLVGALRRRIEKRSLGLLGMGLCCLCQLTVVPLWLAGLLPPERVAFAVTIAAGLSSGGLAMAVASFSSMMADVADEHEMLFGTRREGLLFSGASVASKVAVACGAMAAGFVIDLIGFPTGLAKGDAPVIAAETLRNLGAAYGPGSALLIGAALLILSRYHLGSQQHAAIRAALEERRHATAPAGGI